jgi:O-antigen ligase
MVRSTLQTLALVAIVALVAIRPLVSESYDSAGNAMTRALRVFEDPNPARTVWFDLVILTALGVALLTAERRRAVGEDVGSGGDAKSGSAASTGGEASGNPVHVAAPNEAVARSLSPWWRWLCEPTGCLPGYALLVVAGVVSCVGASQSRLAINATLDWLCFPLVMWAVVLLARVPWQRHLLLAAILASAACQAAQCGEQYFVSQAGTVEMYEENKADFWAAQGVPLDDPRVELYERRLAAREASGYLPHPNVTGSYLVLTAFAAAGLAWSLVRRSSSVGVPPVRLTLVGLLTVALAGATLLTGSVGAIAAGVGALCFGGLLYGIARGRARWTWLHRRGFVWAAVWIAVLLGGLATVGHGFYHGKLPGASLTFRWEYWTASAEMIADHPWAGVGRENFGRHYLRHKSIKSPEEISNPHNLFVHTQAETGVLGTLGLLAMLLGGSYALCVGRGRGSGGGRGGRCGPREVEERSAVSPESAAIPRAVWVAAAAVAGLVLLGRLPMMDTGDPAYLYYNGVVTALVWIITFVVCFIFACDVPHGGTVEDRSEGDGGDEAAVKKPPAPALHPLMMLIGLGLIAFLLHDMINFAVFVPATATTFFALLGLAFPERCEAHIPATSTKGSRDHSAHAGRLGQVDRASFVGGVVLLLVAGGVAVFVLTPVEKANALLRASQRAMINPAVLSWEAQPPARYLQQAADADTADSTAHANLTKLLLFVSEADTLPPALRADALAAAPDVARAAIEYDPLNTARWQDAGRAFALRGEANRDVSDLQQAVACALRVTKLYPSDPDAWIEYADALRRLGSHAQQAEPLTDALGAYARALELDGERPEWEVIRRLPPREVARVQKHVRDVAQQLEALAP